MPEFRVNFASGLSILCYAETPEEAIAQARVAVADLARPEVVVSVDEIPPLGSARRVLNVASPAAAHTR